MIDTKLRDDMMYLRGELNAWKFIVGESGHYDLLDHMTDQYEYILKRLFKDFKDD